MTSIPVSDMASLPLVKHDLVFEKLLELLCFSAQYVYGKTRIKKVMQSDEEIGRMVASVPVAIGRAMEHFAEKFLQAAAQATQLSNSRTLTPAHMKQAMMANRHFHFLADIFKEVAVPGRMGTEFDPSGTRQQMQLLQAGLPTAIAQTTAASPLNSPCTPISPMDSSCSTSYGVLQPPNGSPYSVPLPASVPYNVPYSPLLPNMNMAGQTQNVASMQYQSPAATIAAAIPTPPAAPPSSTRKALNGKKADSCVEGEKPRRGRPRKIKRSDKCLDEELCEEVTNGIEKVSFFHFAAATVYIRGSGPCIDATARTSARTRQTRCMIPVVMWNTSTPPYMCFFSYISFFTSSSTNKSKLLIVSFGSGSTV
ncbi:hypothetical protein NECAME_15251 [Necator americanus]|uniref:Transcription factor CBF/NF-Y/archaeal histone domain-containing protein n=1 Tax=Necator americanus TaxID=51031 RepID=W2SIQ3_NECAM|nr:hypothetical protein NECAME_15251 [Necator americanus]ETN69534.1 hypothetical protein NECAME_15251 [Necator americanus]